MNKKLQAIKHDYAQLQRHLNQLQVKNLPEIVLAATEPAIPFPLRPNLSPILRQHLAKSVSNTGVLLDLLSDSTNEIHSKDAVITELNKRIEDLEKMNKKYKDVITIRGEQLDAMRLSVINYKKLLQEKDTKNTKLQEESHDVEAEAGLNLVVESTCPCGASCKEDEDLCESEVCAAINEIFKGFTCSGCDSYEADEDDCHCACCGDDEEDDCGNCCGCGYDPEHDTCDCEDGIKCENCDESFYDGFCNACDCPPDVDGNCACGIDPEDKVVLSVTWLDGEHITFLGDEVELVDGHTLIIKVENGDVVIPMDKVKYYTVN